MRSCQMKRLLFNLAGLQLASSYTHIVLFAAHDAEDFQLLANARVC